MSLKEKDKKMLQTASRRSERRIPPAVWSDKVANAEERQRTNPIDIVAAAHILKWEQGTRTHASPMWDMRMGRTRT